jgi:hypothetical protein
MLPTTTRLLRGRGSQWRRIIQETRYQGAETRKQLDFDLRSVRPVPPNLFDAILGCAFGVSAIYWAHSVTAALEKLNIRAP